jgi:multidrug efflux pump
MMPIATGFGAGGEARMPLGVAVAGGMLTSTALTLLVIPVMYTLVAQLQALLLGDRAKHPQLAEPGAAVAESDA